MTNIQCIENDLRRATIKKDDDGSFHIHLFRHGKGSKKKKWVSVWPEFPCGKDSRKAKRVAENYVFSLKVKSELLISANI